jgi:hypothetical protein
LKIIINKKGLYFLEIIFLEGNLNDFCFLFSSPFRPHLLKEGLEARVLGGSYGGQ